MACRSFGQEKNWNLSADRAADALLGDVGVTSDPRSEGLFGEMAFFGGQEVRACKRKSRSCLAAERVPTIIKRCLAVIVVLAALPWIGYGISATAYADELELVKGKGVCVCEAHLKNLNTAAPAISRMICERDKYYPEKNGITRPKWKKLDLWKNRDLLRRVQAFFSYGDQFSQYGEIKDQKKFRWAFEHVWSMLDSMYTTDADITNTGKPETLLRYSSGRCMYSHVYARALLVVNRDMNKIDVSRTIPLLQNAGKVKADVKTQAMVSDYQIYDVFFYKNKTFFDKWVEESTLSVYKTKNRRTKEICRYKNIHLR